MPGELIQKAGLVVEKQGGSGYYDRFRDRLVFPIMSERGEVIAFGGRILQSGDKTSPKFINSPETAVYSKRRRCVSEAPRQFPLRHCVRARQSVRLVLGA